MTSKATRGLIVLAFFATSACILDFEGLSGGNATPGGTDAGGDVANPNEASTGEASTGSCPGTHGPKSVRVTSGSTSFCIDSTEVTNGQYAEFLASSPSTSAQVAPCASSNQSFTPEKTWPGEAGLPVVNVDWCDANAYCAWAGKRLCGKIGGGRLDPAARNDAAQSQWFFACSANGTKTFPYGASYDATMCIMGSRETAGSKTACEGGFPGIYDLSASVEEWVDECTSDLADCNARGGNYSDSSGFECATDGSRAQPRMLAESWRGFRCCSP